MTTARPSESVLVLGGGIAGLQAAVDIANLGFHVHLVERTPSIGGRMAQLDKTFPTNDCSMCILAPKMMECAGHDLVTLHTYSDLTRLEGRLGAFRVEILHRSRFVDAGKCTGCDDCAIACPVEVPSEFEMGLANRKAVYKPFPQAVPNVYAITKTGVAPCRDTCPAGVNAQGYIQLVKLGKFDEALEVVHNTMPFAGTIGRICPHPCETDCTRLDVESPVSICAIKRAAADHGKHIPEVEATPQERVKRAGKSVAIVGAGPAGINAAYSLARKGYPVTVFEKLPVVGGMLRVGVPSYRLPWDVLDREIDLVKNLGVKIKTSSPINGPSGIRNLFKNGFKAVLLSVGAHASLKLGIPGEKRKGVVGAVDFLRRHALGKKITVGKHTVIVGGGNAAVDSSRTALRLGARKVTILYRRSRAEMPALSWEVEAALEEGVEIMTLAAPIAVLAKKGKVTGIEVIRMRLEDADSSGRPRPVPIPDSNYVINCDMLIPAIGQAPILDCLGPRSRVKTSRWGTIVAHEKTCATDQKGVFACGDAVTGPATAIDAVDAGNRAAESIHRFLQGKPIKSTAPQIPCVRPPAEDLSGIPIVDRAGMSELSVRGRRRNFKEVEKGLSVKEARAEAERCLNCAPCCECMECVRACQANAVDHGMIDETITLHVGACVVATGFDMMDASIIEEYGAGRIPNVVTGLEFERLLSASGPCGGHVRRPSDGRSPKKIAFIQCVGSRDLRNHEYCSAVCCMHATKEAILANEHERDVRSTIFYMDLRAAGKNFQTYVARAKDQYSVSYVRARPGFVEEVEGTGDVRVVYEDTELRKKTDEVFDLVVLCQAMIPSEGSTQLAETLGIELDEHGFISTPSPLAAPVDTTRPGLLAIGYAASPQDIPDSVVQASAAAGRVAELLRRGSSDE